MRANPTLALLWKVAVGLDVPFHELLGSDSDSPLFSCRATSLASGRCLPFRRIEQVRERTQ
jgi:hypothetical protein